MPRLKWEKLDVRTCCYSADKEHFFGSYWKNTKGWLAHICPKYITWYIKEFPMDTDEKKIKSACQRLINHFEKEKNKWERD